MSSICVCVIASEVIHVIFKASKSLQNLKVQSELTENVKLEFN